MFAILPQILCAFVVLRTMTIEAHPILGDNATAVNTDIPSDSVDSVNSASGDQTVAAVATAPVSLESKQTDFRIDEAALAEYTVHSQAEENGGSSNSFGGFKLSLLPTPAKTAESVNLEHEAIPSKILSAYDNTHKKLADVSNVVPILDTISEHEKYGNNGDMFDGIARSIVNGYEAFSNLLNTIIQKPKEIARSISRGITAQLDIIGGKIVGL